MTTHTPIKQTFDVSGIKFTHTLFVAPDLQKKYAWTQVMFTTPEFRLLTYLLNDFCVCNATFTDFSSKNKIISYKMGYNPVDKKVIMTFISEQNYIYDILYECFTWLMKIKLNVEQQKRVGHGDYAKMLECLKDFTIYSTGSIMAFTKNWEKKKTSLGAKVGKLSPNDKREAFEHEIAEVKPNEQPLEKALDFVNKVDLSIIASLANVPVYVTVSAQSFNMFSIYNIANGFIGKLNMTTSMVGKMCKKQRLLARALPSEIPKDAAKKEAYNKYFESYKVGLRLLLNSCGMTYVKLPDTFKFNDLKEMSVDSSNIVKFLKGLSKL